MMHVWTDATYSPENTVVYFLFFVYLGTHVLWHLSGGAAAPSTPPPPTALARQ